MSDQTTLGQGPLSKTTLYILLSLGSILMLLPFLWMIISSFMTNHELLSINPRVFWPSTFQWNNYYRAMQVAPFGRYFFNSFVVAILGTIGELITTILAAYAFSRMKFWGRDILFAILLATMMVPNEILIIPNFITIANLGWVDRFEALIVPWLASVFSIFLLRQFFLGIPIQLSYAAKVDGCSDFKFLWYVMVPLAKPALITITLLTTISSWNAFLWPLIVTNITEMRTVPVGLAMFRGEAGSQYDLLMAATVLAVLPMFVLYLIMQKYIVAAASRSGLKG
ncbi:MAG: carbohydrate ABC transporter permease [Defluviitaleaceae bacterium]|nr:carbohydrate ABC transporter permease [Defluviitaleaceae bacterium]